MGVNPLNMAKVLNSMASKSERKLLDKESVKLLLNLAGSEHARECVRYTLVKSYDLSACQVRKQFGFENVTERSSRVEAAIEEVEQIRDTVDCLAKIQDIALLTSFGIRDNESWSDQESESDNSGVDDE